MKKIIISIFLVFIFQHLIIAELSSNIKENSEIIALPKIPIYVLTSHSNFNSNMLYKKVYNSYDSFYDLQVNYIGSKYKRDVSKDIGNKITLSVVCYAFLASYIDLYIAAGKKGDGHLTIENSFKYYTPTFTIIGGIIGAANGYRLSKIGKPYPYLDIYNLTMYRNKKSKNQKIIKTKHNKKLESKKIINFINKSDKDLKKMNSISSLIEVYNKTQTYSTLTSNYIAIISSLENPKGEYETTIQFNDRIKKEKIRKKELEAEMEQEIRTANEKREIEKFALLQAINEEISEIQFTKFYDFNISNYNADKQSFTFNISGTEKEIVIPQVKAPKFKDNISDYIVQKTFRPTLYGTWETIDDDYVLINTKTNKILPWEGSLPTYVETAVENPPILSASVKLIEPSGEGYLDAEETAIIQVTISNSGKGSAKKTRISLIQESGSILYYDVSNTIEEIQPEQSIKSEFNISVPANSENENVEFKISFLEEQGFEPSPLTFTAQTRAMLKPELILADFGVDDANGDGKISKGETADITLRLQNIGQGKAKQVSVDISENRLENVFIISEKHFELGDMESSESKDITFTISTNKRVSDVVNINFNIQEKRQQFSIEDKITLELEKTQKQLEPIVFAGKDVKTEIIDVTGLSIDIEQDIPQTSKTNENSLAIIFGIERYKNVSSVTYATRDANFVKEYLNKTIGIKESNIYFKTNDDVGKAEFDKVFSKGGWLDKRVKEGETEIYFYYAGHGAPDIKQNKAYLIPYDGDPNYASQTGYEIGKLYSNLADLGAKSVTVFLDACFSGANRESEMLLADARPIFIEVEGPAAHGITVFSATSSKEISSAWPEKKHGLFSYFLMKGMQGDADVNNDKKLSIKELGDYIQQNVSETAGFLDREQTPQLITDDENRILIKY